MVDLEEEEEIHVEEKRKYVRRTIMKKKIDGI